MTPRASFVLKGQRVMRLARKRDPGQGLSYERGTVTLLDDARVGPEAGWDVYDVLTESGAEESAYGFDLAVIEGVTEHDPETETDE